LPVVPAGAGAVVLVRALPDTGVVVVVVGVVVVLEVVVGVDVLVGVVVGADAGRRVACVFRSATGSSSCSSPDCGDGKEESRPL